jgi:predicted dehydrogenase
VADSPIELEIICEKAAIKLLDKLVITYSDGTVEQVDEMDKATGEKAYWGCSHKYLIKDFHEKLQEGKPFKLTGEQGITTIKMIEAIYKSSETGNYVKLS